MKQLIPTKISYMPGILNSGPLSDVLHPSQQFFSHVRTISWVEPVLRRG